MAGTYIGDSQELYKNALDFALMLGESDELVLYTALSYRFIDSKKYIGCCTLLLNLTTTLRL